MVRKDRIEHGIRALTYASLRELAGALRSDGRRRDEHETTLGYMINILEEIGADLRELRAKEGDQAARDLLRDVLTLPYNAKPAEDFRGEALALRIIQDGVLRDVAAKLVESRNGAEVRAGAGAIRDGLNLLEEYRDKDRAERKARHDAEIAAKVEAELAARKAKRAAAKAARGGLTVAEFQERGNEQS